MLLAHAAEVVNQDADLLRHMSRCWPEASRNIDMSLRPLSGRSGNGGQHHFVGRGAIDPSRTLRHVRYPVAIA
jgi:hypothetical protein